MFDIIIHIIFEMSYLSEGIIMEENIYRKARKKAARKKPLLNNCESAQDLVYIERTKLLSIESGDKIPSPDDVVSMSKVYDAPELCNYYCTNQCPIGKDKPTLIYDDLNEIAVRLMTALHFLQQSTDTIYRVLEDGKINEHEQKDFMKIIETLKKLSYSADSLELWAKKNGYI